MPTARSSWTVVLVLLVALGCALVAAMLVGRGDLSDTDLRAVFLSLRGTRAAAAWVAGAALAAGGAVVQGLFRNPLASPSILGTTAGATLGGQVALLFHGWLLGLGAASWWTADIVLPIGCIIGALLSLLVLLAFVRARVDIAALLLTGFILTSLFLSVGSFLISVAQDTHELGRAVVAFTLGGVSSASLHHVLLAAPLVVVGLCASWGWGRSLDLLLSGEDEASSFGVDVGMVRRWTVIWVALLTAAAVSIGGNVSFVGLVVPHALRGWVGVEHRRLIPASALAGGTFLVVCDVLTRVTPTKGEVPLGVVTGLVGAPLFLVLLVRMRRQGVLG